MYFGWIKTFYGCWYVIHICGFNAILKYFDVTSMRDNYNKKKKIEISNTGVQTLKSAEQKTEKKIKVFTKKLIFLRTHINK